MNYKDVESALERLDQFKHGQSMSARYTSGWYRVYSYNTEIARYSMIEDTWYVNCNKYSATTTRQQNLVKRVIANLDHQAYELMSNYDYA
jgi:hypothetical protein